MLLGEFGFSTASMSPEDSASYETALYLQLVSEGLAGGGKWMLNDYPKGANAVQNAYGVYRADGSAKPVAAAMRGLADYLSRSPSRGGQLYIQGGSSGYRWAYEADDALIVSADDYRGTRLSFDAAGLSQLFLTWPEPARMRLYATSRTELDLDPGAVVRDPKMGGGFSLVRLDGEARTPAPFTQSGSRLKMTLEGGKSYELALPRSQSANPSRGLDYDIPGGHFFTQANGRPLGASATGFAVTDEGGARFWSEFQRLGGVQALGYPATSRFVLDGFVTQAFQKAVLQWRPEAGRAYFLNTFDAAPRQGAGRLAARLPPDPEALRYLPRHGSGLGQGGRASPGPAGPEQRHQGALPGQPRLAGPLRPARLLRGSGQLLRDPGPEGHLPVLEGGRALGEEGGGDRGQRRGPGQGGRAVAAGGDSRTASAGTVKAGD